MNKHLEELKEIQEKHVQKLRDLHEKLHERHVNAHRELRDKIRTKFAGGKLIRGEERMNVKPGREVLIYSRTFSRVCAIGITVSENYEDGGLFGLWPTIKCNVKITDVSDSVMQNYGADGVCDPEEDVYYAGATIPIDVEHLAYVV